jgi:hypothetical protein
MTVMTQDQKTILTATYTDLFRDLVMVATLGQVEESSVWYHDAEDIANTVATNMGITLEQGASVVSSFSPRERWETNVRKAIAFSKGEEVLGLSNNLLMANNSLIKGFDALNGQKTNAFARAIAGDSGAVVIDTWMLKAAQVDFKSPSQSQYNAMASAVRNVASEFGLTPRTTQALIWIVKRGSSS